MFNFNPVTKESGECLAVGRGAIAIRLALENINKTNGRVLVPANICYAAVLPIIYAGFEPFFCDVDRKSGNITFETIKKTSIEGIVAAIIPHMYGNPVKSFKEIVHYLHSRNIVVIEDCASLMTRDGDKYIPGTIGDYVIYSTGYSKTIDIGYGGLLFSSKYRLRDLELLESQYNDFDKEYVNEWSVFSALYRVLRNTSQSSMMAKSIYKSLPKVLKDSYTFSISENKKEEIVKSISDLDDVIVERRKKYQIYYDHIRIKDKIYAFESDAVPWRFNLMIDEGRKSFIESCLEKKLPISDWYPCVTPVFNNSIHFEGAEWHESHIVNFPLLIPDQKIINICEVINSFEFV